LQSDTKLARCHVICYGAGYNLMRNLQIPKSGGGEYEIRSMTSAYNAESSEARCYLELTEQVREKKLVDCMTAMGAKLAGPPTTFSAKQAGQRSSYDDECAASLFSVHQDSNKPGWTLVERGTPSVQPREMVRARAGDAVAREHEDLVVERLVMLENPGDYGHDGTVLGKHKATDGGAAPFVEADCCRSGKKSKPGVLEQFFGNVQGLEAKNAALEAEALDLQTRIKAQEAGTLELQTRIKALEEKNQALEAGALELQTRTKALEAGALELQTRNEELEAGTLELQTRNGALEAGALELQTRNGALEAGALELQTRNEALEAEKLELQKSNEALEEENQTLDSIENDLLRRNEMLASIADGELTASSDAHRAAIAANERRRAQCVEFNRPIASLLPAAGFIVLKDASYTSQTWMLRFHMDYGNMDITEDELKKAFAKCNPIGCNMAQNGGIGYALLRHNKKTSLGKLMSTLFRHFGFASRVEFLDPDSYGKLLASPNRYTHWYVGMFNTFIAKVLQASDQALSASGWPMGPGIFAGA